MKREFKVHLEGCSTFLKNLKENKPFLSIDAEFIEEYGFEVQPLEGHKFSDNFPNCCEYHKNLKEELDDWFLIFPNCCEYHKKIASRRWFKKDKYESVPGRVLNQINYTIFFIKEKINDEKWFQEITDYIEYNLTSFGTPAIGTDKYWLQIKHQIAEYNSEDWEFPKWKRERLMEYFYLHEKLDDPKNNSKNEKKDLNLLFSTFQKWQKTFPDLSYFQSIKKDLNNKFPINIILYEPTYNKYTKRTKFKVKTQAELIEILINLTKNLLSNIDTNKLINDNKIKEKEKLNIDLISASHRIKQDKLLVEYSSHEVKYVKIIKKWLKNEVEFIKELQTQIPNVTMEIKIEKATINTSEGGSQIISNGNYATNTIGDNSTNYTFENIESIKELLKNIQNEVKEFEDGNLKQISEQITKLNSYFDDAPQKPTMIKGGLKVLYDLLIGVTSSGISPPILMALGQLI